MTPNSIKRREDYKLNGNPLINEILLSAKSQKLKIVDNVENLVITWPNSEFVAFVSKLSGFSQFYIKGFGYNQIISNLNDYETVDDYFMDAAQYKRRLENGEIVREFTAPEEQDEEEIDRCAQISINKNCEYIVINVLTSESKIFSNKRQIEEYLSCSRVSVDSVLNGKQPKTKGHYIKRIV